MAQFIFRKARVDSNWAEHVLVGIITNLPIIIRSTGPELSSITFSGVVNEENSVIFAASDLADIEALHRVLNHCWLSDTISVRISQSELTLISIATAKDLILERNKDGVATSSLQVFDSLMLECLGRNHLWCKDIL